MSGKTVEEFIGYWQSEGEAYAKRGDYDWMASLVPGKRVLEIGCGLGFGTQALIKRGCEVLAIDSLPPCLAATEARVAAQGLQLMQADIMHLDEQQRGRIDAFAPDTVVCWLMGAPAEVTGAQSADAGQAVAAYREKVQRQVAELASSLPAVQALHFVDRTAIPWQAKDIGRDTLTQYHAGKVIRDLPFKADRRNALYRKLEENVVELAKIRQSHPALRSVVPTLASMLLERKK